MIFTSEQIDQLIAFGVDNPEYQHLLKDILNYPDKFRFVALHNKIKDMKVKYANTGDGKNLQFLILESALLLTPL